MTRDQDTQKSCIYRGQISHTRHVEKHHAFSYRLFMLYLDLDEIETLAQRWWFFGLNTWNLISFWRKDYLPSIKSQTLKDAVAQVVKSKSGRDVSGKVFVLTHPRWFGFVINPLTLYYCFSSAGELDHIVGEITNTPWNERHCYVMSVEKAIESRNRSYTFNFPKDFHVSPFLPMNMAYTWRVSTPLRQLAVNIWNRVDGRLDFEAHLTMKRAPLSVKTLLSCWVASPWITFKVLFGIYWNAGILYLVKRVSFFDHPPSRPS